MAQQTMDGGPPAASYERYFVPAIGEPLARGLVELAGLRPGEQVLDVGCGTGVVARLAAERVGHALVAGVDVDPGMLAVARTASAGAGIEWHEASAEALPLGDATFDVVTCSLALQFVSDRPGALREMRRVLRPGGRVALIVPGPEPDSFGVLEDALRRHLGPAAGGFVAAVFSLHEPEEVRGLLEAAGFAGAHAQREQVSLPLPAPPDFLWQYVHSTPLAAAAAGLDDEGRAALEREVVAGWEPFAVDGRLVMEVGITSATGRHA